MRANMRWVSSTDEIFFVRMASAACRAVAKSSSGGADGEEFCSPAPCFVAAGAANISEAGKVDAARASGTEARKSRRFICEIVKAEKGSCKPKQVRQAILFVFHGSGISRTTRRKFFEPFFTPKETPGRGPGLWLTKDVIDRHHGLIQVRN
jgi:hypothetical protein